MTRWLWFPLVAWACVPPPAPREAAHLVLPMVWHYDTERIGFPLRVQARLVGQLAALWIAAQNDSAENAACLYGRVDGDVLYLDSLTKAQVFDRQPRRVTLAGPRHQQGCLVDEGFVGGVHTHLRHGTMNAIQAPSHPDFGMYWRDRRAIFMLVVSGARMDGDALLVSVFWVLRDGRWAGEDWTVRMTT